MAPAAAQDEPSPGDGFHPVPRRGAGIRQWGRTFSRRTHCRRSHPRQLVEPPDESSNLSADTTCSRVESDSCLPPGQRQDHLHTSTALALFRAHCAPIPPPCFGPGSRSASCFGSTRAAGHSVPRLGSATGARCFEKYFHARGSSQVADLVAAIRRDGITMTETRRDKVTVCAIGGRLNLKSWGVTRLVTRGHPAAKITMS